jgi:hypothetical protein
VLVRNGVGSVLSVAPQQGDGAFDEDFVQNLLFTHPECLPLHEIEPGLGRFRSVCRELPTKHGPIDNVFMTSNGDVAIVEAKLWRNPEARRKVVAQALDYASCLFEMTYADFEEQVLKADFGSQPKPASLYALFDTGEDALAESEFVDAVSRNLQRGRIIVLVVGDGIRSETERLTQALQSHAGFHFTFALVELAVFSLPGGDGMVVVPNTLAQTRLIERGVVRVEAATGVVTIRPPNTPLPPTSRTAGSISSEQFFEIIAQRDQGLPSMLQSLISRFEAFGAYAEFKRGLNLKWEGAAKAFHLGLIQRDGQVWTDTAGSAEPRDLSRQYIKQLAKIWDGQASQDKRGFWYVTIDGRAPKIEQVMRQLDAWPSVAEEYITKLREQESRLGD